MSATVSAAAVRDAERRADDLARSGASAAAIDAADDETERLHRARVVAPAVDESREDYIDRLGAAVDRAFAERDRMWAANGYDDPAAARQEERAVALLDRYNAEVQKDMAEVERRRAENLARFRDEQWMSGCDAARSPLPPPPAAEPYTPRKRPDLAELRRGRWYDTHPITSTGTTGGAGMASIEEVRAAAMAAIEKANEGLGAAQQAHASLEEAQAMFMRAAEGSGQADASEVNGLLAQSVNSLDEVRQQVAAAIAAAQGFGNRL